MIMIVFKINQVPIGAFSSLVQQIGILGDDSTTVNCVEGLNASHSESRVTRIKIIMCALIVLSCVFGCLKLSIKVA